MRRCEVATPRKGAFEASLGKRGGLVRTRVTLDVEAGDGDNGVVKRIQGAGSEVLDASAP